MGGILVCGHFQTLEVFAKRDQNASFLAILLLAGINLVTQIGLQQLMLI